MEILSSLPGAGRLATLLAEASPAPQRRPALPVRSRAVTRRSGKSVFVLRRLVTRKCLQDAMHRRTAVQRDAKAKYAPARPRARRGVPQRRRSPPCVRHARKPDRVPARPRKSNATCRLTIAKIAASTETARPIWWGVLRLVHACAERCASKRPMPPPRRSRRPRRPRRWARTRGAPQRASRRSKTDVRDAGARRNGALRHETRIR